MLAAKKTGSRRALLLIDFQNDFLHADGRMPVCSSHVLPVLDAARSSVAIARRNGDVIAKIGNEFPSSAVVMNLFRHNAAIADSPGAEWDDRLAVSDAKYFPKWKADAFCNADLTFPRRRGGVNNRTRGTDGTSVYQCNSKICNIEGVPR